MTRLATAFLACLATAASAEVPQGPKNVPEFAPAFENQTRAPQIADGTQLAAERISGGLVHPWGIAVLPEGGYLVTERIGRLVHIGPDGGVTPIAGVSEDIAVDGQGGLLDVALAEDFAETRRIFLTYAKRQGLRSSATAAATAVLDLDAGRLTDLADIFVQTPARSGGRHFGSRIVTDGGAVFVTTGDRGEAELAQDLRAAQGKVVRVTADGGIPSDNPFAGQAGALGEIWSFGHRNLQGAARHPETGALWTLEHGPAGGDELNRIEPGANYGWPMVSYGENYSGSPVGSGRTSAEGVVEPRYYWDPVIAPGGFTFYDGDLFEGWRGDVVAASLNPGGLVRLRLDGETVTGEARYLGDLGRIRDVAIDRDGAILVVTDDPDGGLWRVTPR
jgi:glucose/arabinose dehydrogenase